MSIAVEFGLLDGARNAREEWEEYICPLDDDARQKTVHFVSDTPEHALDRIQAAAQTGRAEGESGSGQADLTDEEKNRLGPFTGSNNYLKAASVKALLRDNGVSDWSAWYDAELSVDEHRSSVLPEAQKAGGGDRIENDGPDRDAAARAEKAVNEECDHAADHCRHGEPEACEYLSEACGYDTAEIDTILSDNGEQSQLVTVGGGDYPEMEVSPQVAGALSRSWQGYKGAVGRLDGELADVREAVINAQQAMAAINRIREQHGQDELHPDRLHDLLEALGDMPESIPKVRTLAHYGAGADGSEQVEEPLQVAELYGGEWYVDCPNGHEMTLSHDTVKLGGGVMECPVDGEDFEWTLPDGAEVEEDRSDGGELIEQDPQRDLSGNLSDPQARFAGGETGEVESKVEQQAEENPGGLEADMRETTGSGETEQEVPDEFQVAEGGQETL